VKCYVYTFASQHIESLDRDYSGGLSSLRNICRGWYATVERIKWRTF
jgi:hypothetical protein